MATVVKMPQLGESVVEGTIGKWLVQTGQSVKKDQPLLEILTDKADAEIPSPVSGVVGKILAAQDQIVSVGAALCEINEGAVASGEIKVDANVTTAATATSAPAVVTGQSTARATPSARKLARERDVDLSSLQAAGGAVRIERSDVLMATAKSGIKASTSLKQNSASVEAVVNQLQPQLAQPELSSQGPRGAFRVPAYIPNSGDEIVPFTRRRRIIADHMVYSKRTSPDVVTFAECDLHKTAKLRSANKQAYEKEGVSLTYLAFVVAATARALREFPDINARVLDDAFVRLAAVNVGVAVDTPEGLVVPVIRNADELTIRGIARSVADLASRARDGELTPDDLSGKTFTISNPGLKGNLVGGAIISQPNVGILRVGTIKKRVVVVERDGEDLMAIHPVMHMALSYDHRIVDGVNANGFLYRINEILEQGDFEL